MTDDNPRTPSTLARDENGQIDQRALNFIEWEALQALAESLWMANKNWPKPEDYPLPRISRL